MKTKSPRKYNDLPNIRKKNPVHPDQNYYAYFEALDAAIIIYDLKTNSIIDSNKKMSILFGYSKTELKKLRIDDIIEDISPGSRDETLNLVKKVKKEGPITCEKVATKKSGEKFWIDINLKWIDIPENDQIIAVINDIVRRKSLEKQLFQSQKMEAMGRLASGIAHDFNNLLTVISGQCELTMKQYSDHGIVSSHVDEIQKAISRASILTEQLLTFSRRQAIEPQALGLNTIVRNLENIILHIIGKQIEYTTSLDKELEPIRISPGLVDQIILNMAINARDAMPDGGKFSISTNTVKNIAPGRKSNKFPGALPGAQEGRYTCLTVSDTGIGMDKKLTKKIFKPFFSTKDPGKGTGLGLSVIHDIVKQYKGWIDVESAPGAGTTFNIYFPSQSLKTNKTKGKWENAALKATGEKGILLVEDEDIVRRFTSKVLLDNGYNVLEAGSAKEALSIFKREMKDIDTVFCDLFLPDRNGIHLVEELLSYKPGLKVLVSSGYSCKENELKNINKRGFVFLQKPYIIPDIIKAIETPSKI